MKTTTYITQNDTACRSRILAAIVCLAVFFIFAAPIAAHAADEKAIPPIARKAEAYLNNLKTAEARFVQRAHNGNELYGTFYLSRPGRLRFEYDEPIQDFIVADGYFIYFYDAELGEQSNAPIGQTMADFLLRKDLRFSGEIQVTGVRREGDTIEIALVQRGDPEAGSLVLCFSEAPFQLRKWRVIDSMGYVTETELMALRTGVELDDSLFIYQNPRRFEDFKMNR